MKTIMTRVLFVSLISSLFFLFSCNKEGKPVVELTKEEKLLKVQKWIAKELRVPEAEYLSKKWVYDNYELLSIDMKNKTEVKKWLRNEDLSLSCFSMSLKLMPEDNVSHHFEFGDGGQKFYIKLYKMILGNKYKKRVKLNNLYYLKDSMVIEKKQYELYPEIYCDFPKDDLTQLLVKYFKRKRYSFEDIERAIKNSNPKDKNRWSLIYENYKD